jgi:hypothetical protein
MRNLVLLIAALAVCATAAEAKTRKHSVHRPGYGAYAAQPQIACTQFGCLPVPRGCRPATGRTWSGLPTDFDVIACPGYTMYGTR